MSCHIILYVHPHSFQSSMSNKGRKSFPRTCTVPQCYIMLYSFMSSSISSLFQHFKKSAEPNQKTFSYSSDPYIPSSSRYLFRIVPPWEGWQGGPEFLKTFDSLILYIYIYVCVWAFLWPRSLTEMVIGPESSLEYLKERPKMKNLQQCANTTTCINIPHFGRSTFYVLLHPSRSLCILLHPCFHLPSETFRYQTTFCPNKPFGGTHHLQGQCVSTSFKAWRQRF